jgi:hypothetical protein
MSGRDKRLINDAAKRHKMTVGDFVARACQDYVMRERQALHPLHGEVLDRETGTEADASPPRRLDRVHEQLAVLAHAREVGGMTQDLKHRLKRVMAAFDEQEGLEPPPQRSRKADGKFAPTVVEFGRLKGRDASG